jgi:VIT1/CCC1 family predicted Fe2+/Mn2+ transporter
MLLAPHRAGPHNRGVGERRVVEEELQVAIEARKELGAEMEPAVIDAFVERIEQRLAQRSEAGEQALKRKRDHQKEVISITMGVSIPLLAIAAIFTGLAGVIAVCVAVAVVAIVAAR